jgi:hypothetical protein
MNRLQKAVVEPVIHMIKGPEYGLREACMEKIFLGGDPHPPTFAVTGSFRVTLLLRYESKQPGFVRWS